LARVATPGIFNSESSARGSRGITAAQPVPGCPDPHPRRSSESSARGRDAIWWRWAESNRRPDRGHMWIYLPVEPYHPHSRQAACESGEKEHKNPAPANGLQRILTPSRFPVYLPSTTLFAHLFFLSIHLNTVVTAPAAFRHARRGSRASRAIAEPVLRTAR